MKMDPDWVDVFPIKHGDIPASYVRNYQRVHQHLSNFWPQKGRFQPRRPQTMGTLQDLQSLCKPLGFSLLTSELNELKDWVTETFVFFAKKVGFFWVPQKAIPPNTRCWFYFFFRFPDFCIFFLEGLKPPTSVDILSTDTLNVRLMYETLHCLQGLFWSRRKYMG